MGVFRAMAGRRAAAYAVALALVLQFAAGLLHGLAAPAAGGGIQAAHQLVVICTAQGVRTIALDEEGRIVDEDDGPGAAHGAFCVLCSCVTGTFAFASAPAAMPLPGASPAGRIAGRLPAAPCMGREPDCRRGQDPPLQS